MVIPGYDPTAAAELSKDTGFLVLGPWCHDVTDVQMTERS